jgi:hypothetical protein
MFLQKNPKILYEFSSFVKKFEFSKFSAPKNVPTGKYCPDSKT